MSAPRKGIEVKLVTSVRLEPSEKDLLIKYFGGVQAAIDSVLEKLKNESETETERLGRTINAFKEMQKKHPKKKKSRR